MAFSKKQNINRPLDFFWGFDSLQTNTLVEDPNYRSLKDKKRVEFVFKSGSISERINERWIAGENFETIGYGYIFSYNFAGIMATTCIDTLIIQTNENIIYVEFVGINQGARVNIIKSPKKKLIESTFESIVINSLCFSNRVILTKDTFSDSFGIKIKRGLAYIPRESNKDIIYLYDFAGGVIVSPTSGISSEIDTIPLLDIDDGSLGGNENGEKEKKYYDFRDNHISIAYDENKNLIEKYYTVIDQTGIFIPIKYNGKIIFYLSFRENVLLGKTKR